MKKLDIGFSENENVTLNSPDKWHLWFKIFLWATIIIPIILVIAQLYFTLGGYSTDIASVSNWKTLTETFALPITVFTGFVALTTLIGMYHRSLQLSEQLNKVERQLTLVERKDNFQLYFEHVKQFEFKCNYLTKLYQKGVFKDYFENFEASDLIIIDHQKLYGFVYPKNTIDNIKSFIEEDVISNEAQALVIDLEKNLEGLHTNTPLDSLDIGYAFKEMGIMIYSQAAWNRAVDTGKRRKNYYGAILIIVLLLGSLELIKSKDSLEKKLIELVGEK